MFFLNKDQYTCSDEFILSNPHTHTSYVDGKNTIREIIEIAISQGMQSLGFSEHLEPPGSKYTLTPETAKHYCEEIRTLRKEYADRIRIWIGAERDSFSDAEYDIYEYWIASVHHIKKGGQLIKVLGKGEDLYNNVQTIWNGDGLSYVQEYYDTFASYVETQHPHIIAHLDLIRKWNAHYHFFSEDDVTYQCIVCSALERMISSGALLEVNTGAMARGYLQTPYPSLFALKKWKALGGQIIIGSDCHDAKYLIYGFEEARQLCHEAGYEYAWALGTNNTLFEQYKI